MTNRASTNRLCYIHDQYLQYRGLVSGSQGKTIAYARVSSPSPKNDLATQKDALWAYCLEHHVKVDQWIEEIGSALKYKRKGFNQIIEETVTKALERCGGPGESQMDLARDATSWPDVSSFPTNRAYDLFES